jgi:hypothetical protein
MIINYVTFGENLTYIIFPQTELRSISDFELELTQVRMYTYTGIIVKR